MGVTKEACPRCRSMGKDTKGDNLAVYPDGHKHCYGCGHHVSPALNSRIRMAVAGKDLVTTSSPDPRENYPKDRGYYLPVKVMNWLSQYGLTRKEISDNMFEWSEERQLLVMPVNDEHNNLLFWQGRYFGDNPKMSKYVTGGKPLNVIRFKPGAEMVLSRMSTMILVEDIISSIKVGRHYPCLPLCGTNIPLDLISRLKDMGFAHIGIWLDADKFVHAVKRAIVASQVLPSSAIYTREDPKCYEDREIVNTIPVQLSRDFERGNQH